MVEFRFRERRGRQPIDYRASKEIEIAGIPGVVSDPHNEVFGPMVKSLDSRGLYHGYMFHVDDHSDMSFPSQPYDPNFLRNPGKSAKESLDIATFIHPLVYSGFLDGVFHYNPRDRIPLDNRSIRTPVLVPKGHSAEEYYRIDSEGKLVQKDFFDFLREDLDFVSDMIYSRDKAKSGFVLDIDLDAFACCNDNEYDLFENGGRKDDYGNVISQRFYGLFNVLKHLPIPDFISIARSQNPSPGKDTGHSSCLYTVPEIVDSLEDNMVKSLEMVYRRRKAA